MGYRHHKDIFSKSVFILLLRLQNLIYTRRITTRWLLEICVIMRKFTSTKKLMAQSRCRRLEKLLLKSLARVLYSTLSTDFQKERFS